MKSFTVIFCLLFLKCLVLGIPMNPILPIQTCPCNQNTYQVQEPLNVPLVMQQTSIPQQLMQPTIYQQPSSNNLYSQPVLMQNQVTTPYQNQQPTLNQILKLNNQNPLANQISQIYLNKILSNPTVQGILDPNLGLYSPAIVEIPNQMPNNIPNTGSVPQVVNNYFILPPEYLEMNKDFKKPVCNLKNKEIKTERKNQGDNRRRKQNGDVTDNGPSSERGRRRQPKNENQQNNLRRPLNQHHHVANHEHSKENCDRSTRKRQRQDRNPNMVHDNEENRPTKEQRAERRPKRKQSRGDNHRDSPAASEEKQKFIIKIKEMPKQMNTQRESKELVESNGFQKPCDARDDAFIEDFRKKFPGIPEDVVRSLLSYLKRQLQKQQLGNPPFYYPDVSFPLRFDQLFPNSKFPSINLQGYEPRKRRPKSKTSKKPKYKHQKTKTVIGTDTTTQATSSVIDTTTVKSKLISTLKPKEQKKQEKIPETTTNEPLTPELGTEDEVLEINNGLVDDYYPDFSNDNHYFGSEEVFNVRNLRDNRYHYTTDRNYEKEEIIKNTVRRPNNFGTYITESFEDTLIKPIDLENDSEVLNFRSPPHLEIPDFQTKQIIREKSHTNNNRHKDIVFDKSSNYSDAKSSLSTDLKLSKKLEKGLKSKAEIETVLGHSKVVKYGSKDEFDEENDTPTVTYYLPDNMQYEEDGKTVIVAKSIPKDHFW